MADIRLAGAVNRLLYLSTNSGDRLIRIEFTEGQDLPAGELVATATSGEDEVYLVPDEDEASAGILVEVPLYVEDFEDFGDRDWRIVVAVEDDGSSGSEDEGSSGSEDEGSSGSEDYVRYILFTGTLRFTVVPTPVIASTTFTALGS